MNKCILEDNWRFKTEMISHKLVEKIAELPKLESKYINVSVVKFF